MRKTSIFVLIGISLLLLNFSCAKKTDSDPNPQPIVPLKIYNSDILNPSITELKSFYDSGYNVINGDLGYIFEDSLIDLEYLSNLILVKGDVYFTANLGLNSLDGLNNLQAIEGSLSFSVNPALSTLSPLTNLSAIDVKLLLYENNSLKKLDGLNNLRSVGSLDISNSPSL